jgi:hypothetical protein
MHELNKDAITTEVVRIMDYNKSESQESNKERRLV